MLIKKEKDFNKQMKLYDMILGHQQIKMMEPNFKSNYERIKKSLNTLPDENTDLEPYEGTPIEDLFTGCYLTGKMEILDEIIELIEVEQLKIK